MHTRRWVMALGFTIAAATATAAQQAGTIWTQLGNTGQVDEADLGIHLFHDTGSVAIRSDVSSATLDIRYSVAANGQYGVQGTPGEEGPDPCIRLKASLRDTGAGARVVVRLMETNLLSGARRALAEIDSNRENVPSTSYVFYQTCVNVPIDHPFDFRFFAYSIEAQLAKTSAAANPGLKVVQLCGSLACEEF